MVTTTQSFNSANSQYTFTTSNETNGVEITLRGGKGQSGGNGGFSGESAGETTVLISGDIINRTFTLFVGQQGGHSGTRSAGSSPFQGGISGSTGGSGEGSGTYEAGDGGGGGAPSAVEINGNVIAVAGGGDGGAGDGMDDPERTYNRGGSGGSAALSDSYYRNVSTSNDNQTLFYSNPTSNVSVSVQQSTSTNNNASITVTEIKNPPAVNSLSATPTAYGSINLSWLNPSSSVNKELYRSTSHSGNATKIDTLGSSQTSYTDSGLDFNQSYVYYLKQVDSGGEKRGVVASARTPKRNILRYDGNSNEWIPTDLTTL